MGLIYHIRRDRVSGGIELHSLSGFLVRQSRLRRIGHTWFMCTPHRSSDRGFSFQKTIVFAGLLVPLMRHYLQNQNWKFSAYIYQRL